MSTTIDWQTVRPATRADRVFSHFEIPAFAITGLTWKGASEIARQYNFTSSKNFALRSRPTKPDGADFVPCIRYRIGDTVFRYKLWDDAGLRLNGVNLYDGEIIKANFVVEFWTLLDSATVTLEDTLTLRSGIMELVTDYSETPADTEDADGAQATLANQTVPPSSPVAGSAFWFKHDAGVVLSGAFVTQWQDQSGNGRHLAPFTDQDRPVVGGVDFGNGHIVNAISFAVDRQLVRDGLNLQLKHLFVAFRQDSSTSGGIIIDSDSNKFRILQSTNADLRGTYEGTAGAIVPASVDTDYVLHMYRSEATGAVVLEVNGLHAFQAEGEVVPESNLQALTRFSVGDPASAATADMWVVEVIGYDTYLTAAQVTLVKQYLAGRYDTHSLMLPVSYDSGSPWLTN